MRKKTLYNHPEWLDGQFIHVHSTKKKAVQDARWICLNALGQATVEFYLSLKKGLPYRVTWWENLKRWGKDAGIGDDGISNNG